MGECEMIFRTNAKQMCMYAGTFVQSEFVVADFSENRGTILI